MRIGLSDYFPSEEADAFAAPCQKGKTWQLSWCREICVDPFYCRWNMYVLDLKSKLKVKVMINFFLN